MVCEIRTAPAGASCVDPAGAESVTPPFDWTIVPPLAWEVHTPEARVLPRNQSEIGAAAAMATNASNRKTRFIYVTEPPIAPGCNTEEFVPAWVTILRVSGTIPKNTIMRLRVWYLSWAMLRPLACAAAAVL